MCTRSSSCLSYKLSDIEQAELVTNCDRFKISKYSVSLMATYFEYEVTMISAVLKSETAVRISIVKLQGKAVG